MIVSTRHTTLRTFVSIHERRVHSDHILLQACRKIKHKYSEK